MPKKIPTARGFLKKKGLPISTIHSGSARTTYSTRDALIDFARMHVKAALDDADSHVRIRSDFEFAVHPSVYPLTNIK